MCFLAFWAIIYSVYLCDSESLESMDIRGAQAGRRTVCGGLPEPEAAEQKERFCKAPGVLHGGAMSLFQLLVGLCELDSSRCSE